MMTGTTVFRAAGDGVSLRVTGDPELPASGAGQPSGPRPLKAFSPAVIDRLERRLEAGAPDAPLRLQPADHLAPAPALRVALLAVALDQPPVQPQHPGRAAVQGVLLGRGSRRLGHLPAPPGVAGQLLQGSGE